ncbi:MAG TPA: DUF2194 domain-containing protein [Spirochaetia bacterium]|nr:DUF2194 domain-containing protein [Spirochaetia bacterium]
MFGHSARVPAAFLFVLAAITFSAMPSTRLLAEGPYGHTVLGLYKSTEGQTEKENEIFYYLSNILANMGLNIRYWDVDKGLPTATDLNDVRAVISWFRGSSMADPLGYLSFLNRILDAGSKVIVIDNLGAYQNRNTGEYVATGLLNPTLERLGLIYLGDWTDDAGVIRIADVDRAVAEHGGKQDAALSDFFYHFLAVDRDLKVYLSLKRLDRAYGESPVVVTNRNGGFALSRYIYRVENGKVQMLLDLESFIKQALFPPRTDENIALLVDSSDPHAKRIFAFAKSVLNRDKLSTTVIDSSEFAGLIPGDLDRYTAIGLILPGDSGLAPAVLESALHDGGGVVSLMRGNFDKLAGALAMRDYAVTTDTQNGYKFAPGFLLGEDFVARDDQFSWNPGPRLASLDANIIASSSNGKTPLLWSASRSGGTVLVWNWNALEIGDFVGAILESFLYVRPVGIAATAAVGMMYIDDFPLPMYNVVKPPLSIQDTDFYFNVWWPQMKEIFRTHEMPFSAFAVFNYNDRTSPPFPTGEFYAAKDQQSLRLGREILNSRNELGLHGYNHISLTRVKTPVNARAWPSIADMVLALKQTRREWVSMFGSHTLPFSYVAVNNIISEDGIEAIHEAFPSIRVIAALRAGSESETDTPFGPHPTIPGMYFIPRNSWGYQNGADARMRVSSAMSGPGIWTHFIHADDVFDKNRSGGMGWDQLRANFVDLLNFARRNFPWVRYLTVRDGYSALQTMDDMQASFRWEGDRMEIRGTPGLLLRVRLNRGRPKIMSDVDVVYAYKSMPELILRLTAGDAELRF